MLCAPDCDPIEALVTLSHDTFDNTGFVLALLPPLPNITFRFSHSHLRAEGLPEMNLSAVKKQTSSGGFRG